MERSTTASSNKLAPAAQTIVSSPLPSSYTSAQQMFHSGRLHVSSFQHVRGSPTLSYNTPSLPVSHRASSLRPFSAGDGGDQPTSASSGPGGHVVSPNHSCNNDWMSRNAESLRPSPVRDSYASSADVAARWAAATRRAAAATTMLPSLTRLSPYTLPTPSATTTSSTAASATATTSTPALTLSTPPCSPRAFSQPKPFTVPQMRSSAVPPSTTASTDVLAHFSGVAELTATPLHGLYPSRGPASKSAAPPAVQLQLSRLAVRQLELCTAADTAPGPLLLRGVFDDAVEGFCTDSVWPTMEGDWGNSTQHGDIVQTFSAAWPATTITEVVDLSTQTVSAAPSRALVCECYVNNTPPNAPPQLRSETFLGRCEVALDALVEAATSETLHLNRVEAALRDDISGAVVGRLSFAVALLPLPRRIVRLTNVVVLPDPLRADDENGVDNGYRYNRKVDDGRRRRVPQEAAYEGELGLSLAAPTEAAPAAAATDNLVITAADFRTPAAVRWTSLPVFSFYEAPSPASQNAEEATGQGSPALRSPQQEAPLVMGELYYCPSRQLHPSGSRRSSVQSSCRPQVLLGTFAIPPPPPTTPKPGSAVTAAATMAPYQADISASYCSLRSNSYAGVSSYPFQVQLRTSAEGGRWMAMGDCWVRGVVETWTEAVQELGGMRARRGDQSSTAYGRAVASTSASGTGGPGTANSLGLTGVAQGGRAAAPTTPPSSPPRPCSAASSSGSAERLQEQRAADVYLLTSQVKDSNTGVRTPQPPTHPSTPPPPPASSTLPCAATVPTPTVRQEDIALQRVRERQEALIQRVEYRLAEVRQQRRHLKDEMVAQEAQATAEENAVVEEFGLLENQQIEANAAYREATARLAELQRLHADRIAEHDAYLAEQSRALDEVARERAEAVELRAQLEALQTQMRAHMAAEQQRYAARVEHTRAAMGRVEANTRWLTELEAKIAAAESRQPKKEA